MYRQGPKEGGGTGIVEAHERGAEVVQDTAVAYMSKPAKSTRWTRAIRVYPSPVTGKQGPAVRAQV